MKFGFQGLKAAAAAVSCLLVIFPASPKLQNVSQSGHCTNDHDVNAWIETGISWMGSEEAAQTNVLLLQSKLAVTSSGEGVDVARNMPVAPVTLQSKSEWLSYYGDASCMRKSGGTCYIWSCNPTRGPTECVDGLCLCSNKTCANAWGVCEDMKGELLGSYAIKFERPFLGPAAQFLGVVQMMYGIGPMWVNIGPSGTYGPYGSSEPYGPYIGPSGPYGSKDVHNPAAEGVITTSIIAGVAKAAPQWNLTLTKHGFVRIESAEQPGAMLAMYSNRRRRTEDHDQRHLSLTSLSGHQITSNLSMHDTTRSKHIVNASLRIEAKGTSSATLAFADDDDLWPVLKYFTKVDPVDITFQISQRGHSSFEIWHPQTGVLLASGSGGSWFQTKDISAQMGVAECNPKAWSFFSDPCDGHELVSFEPPLPDEAVAMMAANPAEANVVPLSNFSGSQMLILIGFIVIGICCCGACFALLSSRA